jgi:hypothetical protein
VTIEHAYAHELESWLSILIHIHLGYTDIAPGNQPLKGWWETSWDTVASKKEDFFNPSKDDNYTSYRRLVSVCSASFQ